MSLLKRKAQKPLALLESTDPTLAQVDPWPMQRAFAALDEHRQHVAEFKEQVVVWQKEYDDFIQIGDPQDDAQARAASLLKTRLEMAPHQIERYEAEDKTTPPF